MAQPSFVATLGPQAKYDPIIDKDKFEKELVSLEVFIHSACNAMLVYIYIIHSIIL